MINPDMTIYPASPYKHVVSVSSGAPSALLALKAIETYGADNVVCIFADTLAEHEDNYRFLYDLQQRGIEILFVCDGRTPNELQREQNTVYTNSLAPCTRILKLEPIREFIQTMQKLGYVIHMHVGYTVEDAKPEQGKPEGRVTDTKAAWSSNWVMPHFLLVDEQYSSYRVKSELRQRGIQIPETYKNGFPNGNCLGEGRGGCVKSGKGNMLKVLIHYPKAYAAAETTETDIRITQYKRQRARGVRVADVRLYAQLRDATRASGHISLKAFREQYEQAQRDMKQLKLFTLDSDGDLCGAECGVSSPEKWAA